VSPTAAPPAVGGVSPSVPEPSAPRIAAALESDQVATCRSPSLRRRDPEIGELTPVTQASQSGCMGRNSPANGALRTRTGADVAIPTDLEKGGLP